MIKWLKPKPKLSMLIEEYLKQAELSPSTIRLTELAWKKLIQFCGDVRVDKMIDGAGFQKTMKKKRLSPASIRIYRKTVSPVFSYAVQRRYIKVNPFDGIAPPKPQKKKARVFSAEEYKAIYDACPNMYWKAIVLIAYTSGARKSAIQNLRKEDIDFECETIMIQEKSEDLADGWQWRPKDRSNREIPLVPQASRLIVELIYANPSPYFLIRPARYYHLMELKKDGLLSHQQRQHPVSNFDRTFRKIRDRANVKGTFHNLRSTFGSDMLKGGCSLSEVRDLLGHSSCQVTEAYLGSDNGLIKKAGRVSASRLES